MERREIMDKIITILRENLDEWEDKEISESSVLNTDTGMDSIRFIYIMTKVETTFGVSIPERKWSKLSTMGDVLDVIEEEMKKKK